MNNAILRYYKSWKYVVRKMSFFLDLIERKNWLLLLLCLILFCISFGVGIYANLGNLILWDDEIQMRMSNGILGAYGIGKGKLLGAPEGYYGPLWEFIMGVVNRYFFSFLHDPLLVRHSLTFALYPCTLLLTFILLLKAGISRSTATLSTASIFSLIRFGGNSLFNIKDFPAAAFFLIVTLVIWVLLLKFNNKKGLPFRNLLLLGFFAPVPFLVRVPLLLHFGLLSVMALCLGLYSKELNIGKRLLICFIPILTGIIILIIFYPHFWTTDINKILRPFIDFSHFNWHGSTRIFGMSYGAMNVPWWYAFAWIPIVTHPIALFACLTGIISLLFGRTLPQKIGKEFILNKNKISFSIIQWMWIIIFCSFAAIAWTKPTLYDEDRQLLFLYPPLYLLGSLGLDFLRPQIKYYLALILIACSIYSYLEWGKYSYVYKSPLIGNRDSSQFHGDFWGICLGGAVDALQGRVSTGTVVYSTSPHISRLQNKRQLESWFYKNKNLHAYTIKSIPKDVKSHSGEYAYITYNRFGDPLKPLKDFNRPARLLWQETMPPGDTACALILFEKLKDSPQAKASQSLL